MFAFLRRATTGVNFPHWLFEPGPVLLRRFICNKCDPLGERIMLLDANPIHARISLPNGRETTVSTSDLAPSSLRTDECRSSDFPANKPTWPISRSHFLALKSKVFAHYRLISRRHTLREWQTWVKKAIRVCMRLRAFGQLYKRLAVALILLF